MKLCYIALASLLISSPAWADRKDADACAANLPAGSKAIYDAAIGQVKPGADNKALVQDIVKGMVDAGQLSMFNAKSTAQPAGECLKKLAN
jgi:hypothetical protein